MNKSVRARREQLHTRIEWMQAFRRRDMKRFPTKDARYVARLDRYTDAILKDVAKIKQLGM